ncbi:hypothetical protein [Listeria cornellensis]|uniref:Uncharacterized protein n=1 Tax=Listeria cornellensis FSL F6-0969 TaxID=1265820 RepID=W7CGB8_9LIST|nr:hypothetical protein [Listeria cornellensis]EUJ31923.1 hypothetical protein PCORN_03738 [Listeria cornellensis FSL F6-0969]
MKKLILEKVGLKGLIHMLQVFIYTTICVAIHVLVIPGMIGLLPIALLMGVIAIQPTSGITKRVIPKMLFAFVLACLIGGSSSFFEEGDVYAYFAVAVIALLVINFTMPQKYMVITMAIGTALFFTERTAGSVSEWTILAVAFIDVSVFFILVRLILRYVHIPLEKTIHVMMKQTIGLFQKELQNILVKKRNRETETALWSVHTITNVDRRIFEKER